jgi:hypothetical protein
VNDSDPLAAEHLIEGGRELAVAIVDQEPVGFASSGVRGFKMPVHAAARWYSWINPPSRSRRLISPPLGGWSAFVGSGGSSASDAPIARDRAQEEQEPRSWPLS